MLRTKITALLAAGAVGLTLTACGGADDTATGEPAAQESEPASPTPEPEPSPEPSPEPEEKDLAADLVALSERMNTAQVEQGTVHVETTYSGALAEQAGLTGSAQGGDVVVGETLEDTAFTMTTSVMGIEMEMILVEETMYIDMSALSEGEVAYVAMSFAEMGQDPALAGAWESLASMDPAAQAELMVDAVTAFEHVGSEEADGQDVEVYTATIDPAQLDGFPGVDQATAAQLSEMDAEYRVRADGLPVSVDVTMEMGGREMTTSTTFTAWGDEVDITAPPADQVTDWADIAAG